jgi:hypothetical protein
MSKKQVAEKDLVFDGSGDGSTQSPDVRKVVKLLNNHRSVRFFQGICEHGNIFSVSIKIITFFIVETSIRILIKILNRGVTLGIYFFLMKIVAK